MRGKKMKKILIALEGIIFEGIFSLVSRCSTYVKKKPFDLEDKEPLYERTYDSNLMKVVFVTELLCDSHNPIIFLKIALLSQV